MRESIIRKPLPTEIEAIIKFIKQQHFTLTLAVYKKNEKVMQFYRKQNFVVIEERIDSNTNEAELLMSWNRACPIL